MTANSDIEQLRAELTAVIALAKDSNLLELEVGEGNRRFRVRLKEDAVATDTKPTATIENTADAAEKIVARTAGTYLPEHPSLAGTSIKCGDAIKKGDMLAFIKIGPLITPIVAEADGVVSEICCQSGQAVEYGTVLFII